MSAPPTTIITMLHGGLMSELKSWDKTPAEAEAYLNGLEMHYEDDDWTVWVLEGGEWVHYYARDVDDICQTCGKDKTACDCPPSPRCPKCRVEITFLNHAARGVHRLKWPAEPGDSGSFEGPTADDGPTWYECPECNERVAETEDEATEILAAPDPATEPKVDDDDNAETA